LDTLAEIQERHDAVRDVERKLLDLQQVCPWALSLRSIFDNLEILPYALLHDLAILHLLVIA